MTFKEIDKKYYYDGDDLGSNIIDDYTIFKVWSPFAEHIQLNLYKSGHEGDCYKTFALEKGEKGVWSVKITENLDGIYYDFYVTVDGKCNQTADPYARACGLNGFRSMVVDLKTTNPNGFENDKTPPKQSEYIIYEVHIKDFSYDKSGGFPEEYRGKYKAFCIENTTLYNKGEYKTGLQYLKNLGVNYIQLMPIYDSGSVDEANPESSYNWGYDPVNYNVPEGSYATDAQNGKVRIKELKELIQSLHKNGFRVIMDVVYNHTYKSDSWLERTAPNYYYRKWKNGTLSNGSGCGNDIASERAMCSKYILDSVMYWAEEYHIDGFRFDLMGLLDVKLMNNIRKALDKRFGKGEKLIFGEPWAADKTATTNYLANKNNIKKLNKNIGAFSDIIRDNIKGSVLDAESGGFVNGGKGFEQKIIKSMSGDDIFLAPSQIINYVSCHDDLTLFDKLSKTLDSDKILAANRLVAAIYMMCRGRLFFLSGEEFGRTKGGIKNSYNKSIEINKLDWDLAYQNRDLINYYKGLIALRKQLLGLCDKTSRNRVIKSEIISENCVCITVDNSSCNWKQLKLIYNSSSKNINLKLKKQWQILVDNESSFKWQIEDFTNNANVKPLSALILGKK